MRQTITSVALVLLLMLGAFYVGYQMRQPPQASVAVSELAYDEVVLEARVWTGENPAAGVAEVNQFLKLGWSLKTISAAGGDRATRVYHLVKRR